MLITVSEPLNDDGSFRSDVFFNTLGSGYIATALRAARAADPNAKLYINDFNIEGSGAKATAMMNLVRSLQQQGVPIDGVGFQCHFIVGQIPSTFQQNLQAFTNLGIEVAITELDVRMTLPSTPALLQQQKQDYQTVIQACIAVARCVGITLWDWTDKFSFVPSTFPGMGAADPWDQVRAMLYSCPPRSHEYMRCRTSSRSPRLTVSPLDWGCEGGSLVVLTFLRDILCPTMKRSKQSQQFYFHSGSNERDM